MFVCYKKENQNNKGKKLNIECYRPTSLEYEEKSQVISFFKREKLKYKYTYVFFSILYIMHCIVNENPSKYTTMNGLGVMNQHSICTHGSLDRRKKENGR